MGATARMDVAQPAIEAVAFAVGIKKALEARFSVDMAVALAVAVEPVVAMVAAGTVVTDAEDADINVPAVINERPAAVPSVH